MIASLLGLILIGSATMDPTLSLSRDSSSELKTLQLRVCLESKSARRILPLKQARQWGALQMEVARDTGKASFAGAGAVDFDPRGQLLRKGMSDCYEFSPNRSGYWTGPSKKEDTFEPLKCPMDSLRIIYEVKAPLNIPRVWHGRLISNWVMLKTCR
jgi:hypothetical protein